MPEYNFITIEEFAEFYGCSVKYAQKLVREGKAPDHYTIGRTVRFTREAVDRWIQSRFVKGRD